MSAEFGAFDVVDLRRRIERTGDALFEPDDGDHRLNPELEAMIGEAATREAAVLVGIVDREAGASVLLTTRAAGLRTHSGQIAFPGGAVDPGDAGAEAAALREAWEEVGLEPHFVEVLGLLPRYRTTTGFSITPVLAIVQHGFALRPNPTEVDDVFEVPLGFLMDETHHLRDSRVWKGHIRHFYTMPFGERYIWGVTAGILRTLYERLYAW